MKTVKPMKQLKTIQRVYIWINGIDDGTESDDSDVFIVKKRKVMLCELEEYCKNVSR